VRGRLMLLLAAVCTLAGANRPLQAQPVRINLSVLGLPFAVTTTDGADFEQGFVILGSFSFTVQSLPTSGSGTKSTTVQVRCRTACPRSGTLPVSGLQWRRVDTGTWVTATTGYQTLETRTLTVGNAATDPWSNSVQWRYLLSWTANPPTAAATQYRLEFRLTVANP